MGKLDIDIKLVESSRYQGSASKLVTLFAVHCAGCFNYLIADRYPDSKRTWIGAVYPNFKEESLWDRYVTAIYWSIPL